MSGSYPDLTHRSISDGLNPVPMTFGTCESSGRLLYRPLWKKGQHSDCYQDNQGRQPNAAKTQGHGLALQGWIFCLDLLIELKLVNSEYN